MIYPAFSICHTSARPEGWQESYLAWLRAADAPHAVEYILSADRRFGFTSRASDILRDQDRLVWCVGPKNSVTGFNQAAIASSGDLLIMNDDDLFPPEHWDTLLWNAIQGRSLYSEFVIGNRLNHPMGNHRTGACILSRARFEKLGYVFFPGYQSMYSDDEFGAHAKLDGVVIPSDLVFRHAHAEEKDYDDVYRHQNSPEAYEQGALLFQSRLAAGFKPQTPKRIAFVLPGEDFSHHMLSSFWQLWANAFAAGFSITMIHGACSDVRITRTMLHGQLFTSEEHFDYIVWIDHDNPVTWGQVQLLIADLEVLPENSVVVGWTLIQQDLIDEADFLKCPPRASVGMLNGKEWASLPLPELRAANGLVPVDLSGFPLVAMKHETMELMGKFPFQPYVSEEYTWGQTGEDVSFCLRLKELGGQVFVDPRIEVPHLKLRPVREIRSTADTRPEEEKVSAVTTT